ncbi:lytic polysaccharide monooxygenase [Streptomyces sp. NPDC006430]|uniref:lytic polysaccharide monooxygenase auxiliary activity family 9 protein n=1 Tax=Streptomyces sp. NPDC006430 TaxID=3154299 RepID=UPI0033AA00DB
MLTGLTAGTASAHGAAGNPVDRQYACYQEGPESPKSAACKAAIAASGTQAFYDWNAVRRGDAAGRSRQLVPDGKLCSGGDPKYQGLDLARADWPATKLPSGSSYTFTYKATAPHKGGFEYYITKDGYDPAKPLKWSDLEDKPFLTGSPALSNGSYSLTGNLPKRSGRHLIYLVWQRSDSPEAFYSCSDVVFGGSGSAPAPAQDTGDHGTGSAPPGQAPHGHDHGGTAGVGQIGTADQGSSEHAAAPNSVAGAPVAPAPTDGADTHTATAASHHLAETGGSSSTWVIGAAGALAAIAGGGLLFARRRKSAL